MSFHFTYEALYGYIGSYSMPYKVNLMLRHFEQIQLWAFPWHHEIPDCEFEKIMMKND